MGYIYTKNELVIYLQLSLTGHMFLYSKLLLMKENNIEYDLCVDKNIRTSELSNLKDELMLNICNEFA